MAKSGESLKTVLIVGAGLLLMVFMGIFVALFGATVGEHYGILLALPVAMIIGILFFYDRYFLFFLIILSRSSIDQLLDATRLGSFGLGAVINALVILLAIIGIFERPNPVRKALKQTWLPFLIVIVFGLLIAPDKLLAVKTFLSLLSYASIFALALVLIKTNEDYVKWIRAVFYSSIIPVLYAFVDIAHGGSIRQESEGFRIASTFSHPNVFAFYLVLMISLGFYFFKSKSIHLPGFVRKTLPFYILVMMGLLILTKTRSAWGACFFYFSMYAIIYERKYLVYILLAPILGLMVPEIRERFMDLAQGNEAINNAKLNSYAWRKLIWESGFNYMQPIHYIYGYGLDAFRHFSKTFFSMSNDTELAAHNVYVQLFFDTGAIGIASFVWLYGRVVSLLIPFYKKNKLMVFSAIMFVLEFAFECYSDNMLGYLGLNWYLWFVLGAAYAVNYSDNDKGQESKKESSPGKSIVA